MSNLYRFFQHFYLGDLEDGLGGFSGSSRDVSGDEGYVTGRLTG